MPPDLLLLFLSRHPTMEVGVEQQPGPKRRTSLRLCLPLALSLALGLSGLFAQAANAAPSVTFGAEFAPWSYFNEGGILGTELTFAGAEYHGQVAPLTSFKLQLPIGSGLTTSGFPTCSKETLGPSGQGPAECPEGSAAGPVGSFEAFVSFGSEAVGESGTVEPFFGPGNKLYLFFFGHEPVLVELIAEGHIEAASGGHGPTLVFDVPLVETVPGAPDMSITGLSLELGATREEAGGAEVNSVTLPSACSSGGVGWIWSVEAGFNGEAATPVAEPDEQDCLQSGTHLRSKSTTSLGVSSLTPFEAQPVTYTATVQPGSGPEQTGLVTTGSVTFYEGVEPVAGCANESLAMEGAAGVASCTVSYSDLFVHRIHASYSGGEYYRTSSSAPQTITVQEGSAPTPEPEHKASKEGPKEEPHETLKTTIPNLVTVSSSQLVGLLKKLVPSGKAATIGALRKHGELSLSFAAPEAGTLTVQWYQMPKGAKLASHGKPKPVLVASGHVAFTKPGTGSITVKLTVAGKKLVRTAKRLGLMEKTAFVPVGAAEASARNGLVLRG
jgi:Bacterial Ig-like domain (group 3)